MPAALCMEPSDRLQHAPLAGVDHRVVGKALCAGMTATATEAGGIACHRPLGLARQTRPTPSDTGVQKATRSRRPLAHDQAQPLGFWVAAVLHGFAGQVGGCAEFCVNGQFTAGESLLVRKHNDNQEARSTARTAGQPAGRLQEA